MPSPAVNNKQVQRLYTRDEKIRLLEALVHARAAGEQEEAFCQRVGVSRSTLHNWRVKVERGEELTDTLPPEDRVVRNKPPIDEALRLAAVKAIVAGKESEQSVADRLDRHISSVKNWVMNYREGFPIGSDRSKRERLRKVRAKVNNKAAPAPAPAPTALARPPVQQLEIGHFTPRGELDALKARIVELESENKRRRANLKHLVPMLIDD